MVYFLAAELAEAKRLIENYYFTTTTFFKWLEQTTKNRTFERSEVFKHYSFSKRTLVTQYIRKCLSVCECARVCLCVFFLSVWEGH